MERLSFRTSRFWLLPLLLVAGCASNVSNLLTPPEGAVAEAAATIRTCPRCHGSAIQRFWRAHTNL